MFVETSRGWVALSAIRAVERSRARDTVTLFYGEETATITAPAWEMALQRAGTFIPAQPGTYLLHEVGGGEEFEYMKANVVAWTMDAQGYFYPVAAGGINDGVSDQPPILFPDGRVELPDVRSYETLQEWEQDQRQTFTGGS